MCKGVNQIFGLCLLLGSLFCVLTSPIYEDEDLYEGSPCRLADSQENGTCVKLDDCPSRMKEVQAGIRRGEKDRCGFDDFTEIVCCAVNITEKINNLSPAEAACQEYGNEVLGVGKSVTYNILGGIDAEANEFPYMVALGYAASEEEGVAANIQYTCGGTLISRQHVLTAAHCVSNTYDSVPVEVRMGSTNLADTNSEVQRVGIQSITAHEEYRRSRNYNDIAIIKLQEPVRLTNSVQPACLLTKSMETVERSGNLTLIVLGWGVTEIGGDSSPTLKKAVGLRHVGFNECFRSYNKTAGDAIRLPNGIDEKSICVIDANRTRQADTCQGDSGGPLLVTSPSMQPAVAGVTAFGRFCGGSTPSVYTSVYSYMNWIEAQVWPRTEKKRSTRIF